MNKKIFINIFFEKRNILFLYLSILTLFTMFLGIQIIFLGKQLETSTYPAMSLHGALDEDGIFRYKLFNDIGDIPEILKKEIVSGVKFQAGVQRNLLTMNDNFNQIQYRIWGMTEDDIISLGKNLKSGRIPTSGEKELLIGSYAARYFGIDIGDKFNIKVSLYSDNAHENEGEYIVSGIMSDNLEFFKGSVILSKETWELENEKVKDNVLFLYIDNDAAYKHTMDVINGLDDAVSRLISISDNYSGTSSMRKSIINSIIVICVISLIIIILLFFFLMKGMTKKIGLLKALGLPEKNITQIFCGGLMIITLIAVTISLASAYALVFYMNAQASEFYGFAVEEYNVSYYVLIAIFTLNIVNMLAAAITVTWFGKKISPRDAMLKI